VERDIEIYYFMRLTREFEEEVLRLYKQGKILGGVYCGYGQEAVSVGTTYGLEKGDFIFPLHRDIGAILTKGIDPNILLAQLLGKKTGFSKGKESFLHAGDLESGFFGATSMLAATLPVAAGAALKFKLNKEKHIAVAFFGEGASSRGDFHEALNFSGIHKLPIVYVCENNFYAYSTPQNLQMAIEDLADRATGYGFKGMVTSGNDIHAVLKTMQKAVERARSGDGPTLVECKTYRYHGHSEHDMATYRTKEEVIEWESRDPIPRYEVYLGKKGYDLAKVKEEVSGKIKGVIDEAVKFAEESPYPEGKEAMEDLYATPI
jgi:pyruvate dehydrogenase E1 component alpha subunit